MSGEQIRLQVKVKAKKWGGDIVRKKVTATQNGRETDRQREPRISALKHSISIHRSCGSSFITADQSVTTPRHGHATLLLGASIILRQHAPNSRQRGGKLTVVAGNEVS